MMRVPRKAIGGRVREQRQALHLTQAELAERCELDTVYVSQVERGQKTLSLPALYRLAQALNVSPASLLDEKAVPGNEPLVLEVSGIVSKWNEKQRKALLKALRALAEISTASRSGCLHLTA